MVVIIGAGITGLAAAFELARRGIPFVVLEASDRAGGLILTEHAQDFTIDGGPDSLLTQKPAAIELCAELGLASRLMETTPPRSAFVLKNDRLHALPSPSVLGIPTSVGALAKYDLLGWPARARMALEPLVPRSAAADESVGAFFQRRFGRAAVGLIAEPLLGGIHAGEIEQLSLRSLFPRLADAEHEPGRVVRSLARGHKRPSQGLFRGLRGGMSELTDALVAALPAESVRLNCPPADLHRDDGGWQLTAGRDTIGAAAVILAAPAHAARALLADVDPQASDLCGSVPYVSTASIALGFPRDAIAHPLAGSGFVVARRHQSSRITACTWVSSKWQSRAPEGHALLRAFVGGAHDPSAVDATDEALVEVALRDLARVLEIKGAPVLTRVYRWRNAGAQHTVGHRARMDALWERLHTLRGLYVAGSGYGAIGIPDCVAQARQVAAAAADYVRMRA
jgi:protoporphyrinogen/coproporphyrinogen III oxidase